MIRSSHYLALVINAAEEFLLNTTEVKRYPKSNEHQKHYVYYYTDSTTCKRHAHQDNSPKGQTLAKVYALRAATKNKLKQYRVMWDTLYAFPCPKLNLPKLRKSRQAFITRELFDSLVPESNPREVDKSNPYNGINFRSKSEREIAEYLDELGIAYKYEPRLRIMNTDIYPDFVCFIPELGIGFIIEHFGMMDSPKYLEHANKVIQSYLNCGFLPGIDILFTYERSNYPPRANYFESQINRMLDSLCAP